jgi:hypothetical protein
MCLNIRNENELFKTALYIRLGWEVKFHKRKKRNVLLQPFGMHEDVRQEHSEFWVEY